MKGLLARIRSILASIRLYLPPSISERTLRVYLNEISQGVYCTQFLDEHSIITMLGAINAVAAANREIRDAYQETINKVLEILVGSTLETVPLEERLSSLEIIAKSYEESSTEIYRALLTQVESMDIELPSDLESYRKSELLEIVLGCDPKESYISEKLRSGWFQE